MCSPLPSYTQKRGRNFGLRPQAVPRRRRGAGWDKQDEQTCGGGRRLEAGVWEEESYETEE